MTAATDSPPADRLALHHAYLRARLRALGVAEVNLEDAMQDVYEVLVRRIGDYDSRFSLRQWMAGVARKVARRHRDGERRAPRAIDEERLSGSQIDPERSAARAQGLAVLQRFLAGLDADRWAVFVLSEIEGLRGTEIAAELEVNLSTVYARLRSARQQFEAVAAAQRGPGRPWLGGLLVAPTSLFRRSSAAGFMTPLVLCVMATGGLGVTLGARTCAEAPVEAASAVDAPVVAAEQGAPAPVHATGISGREVDPARGVAGPVPDAEGWFNGGSGRREAKPETLLLHRYSYRDEGAELILRAVYWNEGTRASGGFGWMDLDGFDLIEGSTEWSTDLAVGEVRELRWRLRARRPGVVEAQLFDGPRLRRHGYGASSYRRVFEGGVLRPCGEHECLATHASITEAATGEKITLHLHNDCDRAIDVAELPTELDVPPPDARWFALAAGERRTVQADVALGFSRRREDGRHGGSIWTDTPGSVIRFSGQDCGSVGTQEPLR